MSVVAIVGRPNVGKSSLFNRLTQKRKAIVAEQSGVTRDRIYDYVEWNGLEFTLIDTGGLSIKSEDIFEKEIENQVNIAIKEADAIIFIVDVVTGITDQDEMVARMLQRTKKKTILAVNKVDNSAREFEASVFYKLGFKEMITISAINGSGSGDLLDEVVNSLSNKKETIIDGDMPRFAVIGRPNVGKSSFINVIMDEKRNIVTDIAGTTRDSIDSKFKKFNMEFMLIDTAGLRKKTKVNESVEYYSAIRAVKAIDRASVCILMIDAENGLESQDINIFELAISRNKAVIIAVNKWDLIEKEKNIDLQFNEKIKRKLSPFNDVQIVYISAKNKQRVYKVLEEAIETHKRKNIKIQTAELNKKILPILKHTSHPRVRNREVKFKYITQISGEYPKFAVFTNYPDNIKAPYKRFIENQLRENYNFVGIPIKLIFKK